jgi:hypothetical protein
MKMKNNKLIKTEPIRFTQNDDKNDLEIELQSTNKNLMKFMLNDLNEQTKMRKGKHPNRYLIHYPVNNSSINGSSVEDDNYLDSVYGPNSNISLYDGLYNQNMVTNGQSSSSIQRHVTRRQIHVNYNKTQFNTVMLKSFRLE